MHTQGTISPTLVQTWRDRVDVARVKQQGNVSGEDKNIRARNKGLHAADAEGLSLAVVMYYIITTCRHAITEGSRGGVRMEKERNVTFG
jgi:hypothetical protein